MSGANEHRTLSEVKAGQIFKIEIRSSEGLSLAIAQNLYESQTWEIVEGQSHAVITNSERSMVFDLKYFDQMSALASLLYADDTVVIGNEEAEKEHLLFRHKKLAEDLRRIYGRKDCKIFPGRQSY